MYRFSSKPMPPIIIEEKRLEIWRHPESHTSEYQDWWIYFHSWGGPRRRCFDCCGPKSLANLAYYSKPWRTYYKASAWTGICSNANWVKQMRGWLWFFMVLNFLWSRTLDLMFDFLGRSGLGEFFMLSLFSMWNSHLLITFSNECKHGLVANFQTEY